MSLSVQSLLDQLARRGSWYGGGSAAALGCAVAAALLEKLSSEARAAAQARRIRARCLQLVEEDAQAFAQVIRMQASGRPAAFRRALRDASRLPLEVHRAARQLLKAAPRVGRMLKPAYQVDLRCVEALAHAASAGSRALVLTNVRWLGDPAYAKQMRRQLEKAA